MYFRYLSLYYLSIYLWGSLLQITEKYSRAKLVDWLDDVQIFFHLQLATLDTSLLSISRTRMNVEAELNFALSQLEAWADKWLLSFNASKTVYMPISNNTIPIHDLNLSINNSPIKRVNSHKHLGIVLNDKPQIMLNQYVRGLQKN